MSKKPSAIPFVTLRWKGKNATPITIRVDAIESVSPGMYGGSKISYGKGQTATVTMDYVDLIDLMRSHVSFANIDIAPPTEAVSPHVDVEPETEEDRRMMGREPWR